MQNVRALKPGAVVAEQWRIERVLGEGGFGVTYEATNHSQHEHVALKEFMPIGCCSRDFQSSHITAAPGREGEVFHWGRERFMKEAETLARLEHPSIVRVADYFEANGTAYMALTYERGGTLKEWLERLGRRPTSQEVDALLSALIDALAQVHSLFLLHRDIKPDNIMMRSDGTPVLIDFGAVRSAVTTHTQLVGGMSPAATAAFAVVSDGYSPPEQYDPSGRLMGPASDIYALGATVYTMLTGERPPSSASRHLHDTHEPLSQRLAGQAFRPELLAGIDRALSVHPKDRPQSAIEFRRAIALPVPDARTDTAPGLSPAKRAAGKDPASDGLLGELRPIERPRAWRGSSVALAIAVVVGGGFLWNDLSVRRLEALRAEIATASTIEGLDEIARRAPHLKAEIDKRRVELAAGPKAERLRQLRGRIEVETSVEALDRIASAEPELQAEVAARKLLVSARSEKPAACDEGFGSLLRTIAGKQICVPFSEALLREFEATAGQRAEQVRSNTESWVAALRKRDVDGVLGFARSASSVASISEIRKFGACAKGTGLWAKALEAAPAEGPTKQTTAGDPSLQSLKSLQADCDQLQLSPVFPLAQASLVLFQADTDRSDEAGAWLDEAVASGQLGGVNSVILENASFQRRIKEIEARIKASDTKLRLSIAQVLQIISSGHSYYGERVAAAKATGTSYIPAQHVEAARAWWKARSDQTPIRPQVPGTHPASVWRFSESPTAGGSSLIPKVTYAGTANRGFGMFAECRGSGPSIYISIDNPDTNLQRLRFEVPIAVTFRVVSTSSLTTDDDSTQVTAKLTGGYTAANNRIALGLSGADASRVMGLIQRGTKNASMVLVVEVAGSKGNFDFTGARDAFATLKRSCDARKL